MISSAFAAFTSATASPTTVAVVSGEDAIIVVRLSSDDHFIVISMSVVSIAISIAMTVTVTARHLEKEMVGRDKDDD